jgi:hypothetical protein
MQPDDGGSMRLLGFDDKGVELRFVHEFGSVWTG